MVRRFAFLAALVLAGCGADTDGSVSGASSTGGASSGHGGGGGASVSGSAGAGGALGAGGAAESGGGTGMGGALGAGGATGSASGGAGGASAATSAATSSSAATTTSSGQGGGAPVCTPVQQATANGGGRCANLNEAWTARGINVGYYPYQVLQPIKQYSGDFSGDPSTTFVAGGATKGVILQEIPAGAYVGIASTGPWYDPPTGCFPQGYACGSPNRAACGDSSPPMRPNVAGFVWGYAYSGASHMQGWIPFDQAKLAFAGFDPSHPCALGPAGADFEVHAACGQPTACSGNNATCGATNKCNEGSDDCGNASCGAVSGGPLTPSAWHRTVTKPSNDHACTQKQPPHAGVTCLANGGDSDFFFVYPFGAYVYWAQNSTTKHWLHYGDEVQVYFHNHDAQDVVWDFVEVLSSGAPVLTPPSDGSGAAPPCSANDPSACHPCQNGGTCGWVQDVFLK